LEGILGWEVFEGGDLDAQKAGESFARLGKAAN